MSDIVDWTFDSQVSLSVTWMRIWRSILSSPLKVLFVDPSKVSLRRVTYCMLFNWYIFCFIAAPISWIPVFETFIMDGTKTFSYLYPNSIQYWLFLAPFVGLLYFLLLLSLIVAVLPFLLLAKIFTSISLRRVYLGFLLAFWLWLPVSLVVVIIGAGSISQETVAPVLK